MAIIPAQEEILTNLKGVKNIELDTLIDQAHDIKKSFSHVNIDATSAKPLFMDRDRRVILSRKGRAALHTDISEYAFTQVCNAIGVPAPYMKKCYELDMDDVVDYNMRRQLQRYNDDGHFAGRVGLVSDNVCEAVVSDRYSFDFQTPEILETIKKNMPGQYQANQAYLSKSRMHIRFVDFDNPVNVGGEKLSVGFTVGTSDIGKSALQVKFFLYKFACMNGIVVVKNGGTLYRQAHIGEPFDKANIQRFKDSFQDITALRDNALDQIANSQKRMMSESEMHRILDTCRANSVSVSESERQNIIDLAAERYGRTKWGLINGITEVAQNHTLDNRLNYEVWAGKLLAQAL